MTKLRSAEQRIRIPLFVLKVYSSLSQIHTCLGHIFPNSLSRVLVVVFSLAAVFNLFCNVSPAAACTATTVSRVTHAVTALPHGAVLAVYWCRRIRRWRKGSAYCVTHRGIPVSRKWNMCSLNSMCRISVVVILDLWIGRCWVTLYFQGKLTDLGLF